MTISLYTSVSPNSNSLNCVENWRQAGFKVTSVNSTEEARELRHGGIDVVEVSSASRKLPISTILEVILNRGDPFAGVMNADCRFISGVRSSDIQTAAAGAIILAERIDVDRRGNPASFLPGGFDGMFFDTSKLCEIQLNGTFLIGMPWWDYWLPCAFEEVGHTVKKFDCPILLHQEHALNWHKDAWLSLAEEFRTAFPLMAGNFASPYALGAAVYARLSSAPTVGLDGIAPDLRLLIAAVPRLMRSANDSSHEASLAIGSRLAKILRLGGKLLTAFSTPPHVQGGAPPAK